MKNHRILIVEDERLVARDIAMQLQALGYEPLGPATTGEQALEMAEQLQPGLALMDIHLASAMDGITVAHALRTQWGIPCVFMSAFGDSKQHERARLAEPVGYLEKPFAECELREAITLALNEG
jgi:CheY-like chemotaxis protein